MLTAGHLTTQIPGLKDFEDDLKRKTVPGMGFNGDKAYAVSEKNKPLIEIDDVTRIGQGASFNEINSIEHAMLKSVDFDDVPWGSKIIDTAKYQHISLNYYVIPESKMNDAAGYVSDEYCSFKHPSLALCIVVRIFDYWGDEKKGDDSVTAS